jgi:3-hydroxyacyl-CoA dehydrogenase/enoyl-CoA hydratase/3-hydroxybutyryl-CoA epimerase
MAHTEADPTGREVQRQMMRNDWESRRHWKTKQESDGILWLKLDRADRNINTLCRPVLEELSQILEEFGQKQPAGVVISSGKPNGFIAGADIEEFSAILDSSEALKYIEWVHAIFGRLEEIPVPTVSLVQGFCLGGGLELALACDFRIAVDDRKTRFGLPEVKLGIHPGFGGTVRLPRLIGPLQALQMMLSGKTISVGKAIEIGLVDCAVPEQRMIQAAREAILQASPRRKRNFCHFLFRIRFIRFLLTRYLRRIVVRRAVRKHYPAPFAILDLWEHFGGDTAVMYREEARSVANLVASATARNLIRVFLLQQRIKNLGGNGKPSFHSVHVIGGGTMGADIAAWCTLQGLRVSIQDIDEQRIAAAVERASNLFRKKIDEPHLVAEALDRFIPDMQGDLIGGADIVIEAIFEDAKAKRELYRHIEPQMRKDALLATNTSSLPLEELAESLQRPERFVGLHFFNPVEKMELVEVVHGKSVDSERLNCAVRFVRAINRLPLPVSSSPGFLINRILMPYLLEAIIMEQEGIPAADIDRAAREFGMPMGPILLADTVGLDICLSVARILGGHFGAEVPKRLEDLVAMGRLGKKNGLGFYAYKKGKPVVSYGTSGACADDEIADRLILRLLNETIACWRERIVADGDLLDAGAVFGIGFAPFRGGPLHYIRTAGIESLLARIRVFEKRYGTRFIPDPGWSEFPGKADHGPGRSQAAENCVDGSPDSSGLVHLL